MVAVGRLITCMLVNHRWAVQARLHTAFVLVLAVCLARPAFGHGAEISVGSDAHGGGKIVLDFDFSDPANLTDTVTLGGTTLYSGELPGFEWIQQDEPASGLYALPPGTPLSMEIVSADTAASVQFGASIISAPGQSAFMATTTSIAGDHVHPQWRLLLPMGSGAFAISFRVTATASGYAPSDIATLRLTNLPEVEDTPTSGTPAVATPSPEPTPPSSCVGDCNGDGVVAVSDLMVLVNIALGQAPPDDCLAGVGSEAIGIAVPQIIAAVNNLLHGYAAPPGA